MRLFHGAEEVAFHTRSYDAGFIAEHPAHTQELVAAKRQAAGLTRRDRLQQAVPEVALLFERLALRGEPLGPPATRLLRRLADDGAAELAAAVRLALARATRCAGTRRGGGRRPSPRAAPAGPGAAAAAAGGPPQRSPGAGPRRHAAPPGELRWPHRC